MNTLDVTSDRQVLRNVRVGEDVQIYDFVNAYDCSIDSGSRIGTFVEIQKGARIGRDCKIQSHSFICEGVTIEDGVFLGHHVVFVNDKFPRATNADGSMQGDSDWTLLETRVGRGATIGSGSVLLGGLTIGEGALVGAGSVVTKDVPSRAVVVGNPARVVRYLDDAASTER